MARWLTERTRMFGGSIVYADADRTNRTGAAYFPDAISPPSTHDNAMRRWLDELIERQIAEQFNMVLDLGGGDQTLKRTAEELPLVTMLDENGIDAVALHMIGPDLDDLAYLRDVELNGVFAPEQTILCFNEGVLLDGQDGPTVFEALSKQPALRAVVARGGKIVKMPRLGCMAEVDRKRGLFLALAEPESGLGPMNRQRIKAWWAAMEERFEPVAEWLPR